MMAARYAYAKQFNRHRRQLRILRTRLGRLAKAWSSARRTTRSSATAALQYMHDAADDSAIVPPLGAPDIRRQVRSGKINEF
jgi:hypothetical protein